MSITKRIAVEAEEGLRYFQLPVGELENHTCTPANQISAGVYVTDTYYSPRGRVIERRFSAWDRGNGQQVGTYYFLVEDPEILIRNHNGYGLKDEGQIA